jgi:hypothetical protein
MGVRGGILLVSKGSAQSGYILNISHSLFTHNHAEQGGVLFFEDMLPLSYVKDCLFYDNSALRYGATFASLGVRSMYIKRLGEQVIDSGSTLPPYSLAIVDYFWEIVKPVAIKSDFVYFQSFLCETHVQNKTCSLVFKGSDKPMLQDDNEALFDEVEILATPGVYSLTISPILNYKGASFTLSSNITVEECSKPKKSKLLRMEPFPRCILRK